MSLVVLLSGCAAPDSSAPGDFIATATQAEAIDTVLTVEFSTEEASIAWVEWGDDETYGRTTVASDARTDHHVRVVGLPVASTVYWRAVAEVDGEQLHSAGGSVQTSPAPDTTPTFTNTTPTSGEDDFLLLPIVGTDPMAVILDRRGRVTWYTFPNPADNVISVADFSRDGTAVLHASYALGGSVDNSTIERVPFDRSQSITIRTPLGHHDFVELPDGTYAYLKIDTRDVEGQAIVGDSIVEVDGDGNLLREVWNAWDWWEPHLPCVDTEGFYSDGCDWLHGNSLDYDETTDSYVYSALNISTVALINRESGEMFESIGELGTVTPDVQFRGQHSPHLGPEGTLLVFDNAKDQDFSSIREYELGDGTATQVWSTSTEPGQWCFLLGDSTRYASGNTLANWGTVGALSEVGADGEEVWRLETELGAIFGFHDVAPVLGGELP